MLITQKHHSILKYGIGKSKLIFDRVEKGKGWNWMETLQIIQSTDSSLNATEQRKAYNREKSKKNYYKNRAKRLANQADYDKKHREEKKQYDLLRSQYKHYIKEQQKQKEAEDFFIAECFSGKVPRINWDIFKSNIMNCFREEKRLNRLNPERLDELCRLEKDCLYHVHGAPSKKQRIYDKIEKGLVELHVIPEISFTIGRFGAAENVQIDKEYLIKGAVTGKKLTEMLAVFLGLQLGDSMIFKNEYDNKYCINLDASGLDIGDVNGLAKLIETRIETDLTGIDLISHFAYKHSKDSYVQLYRGSNNLLTSDLKSAEKAARKAGFID